MIKLQLLLPVYWFPVDTSTNYGKLRALKQPRIIILQLCWSKANLGGLKLSCWQGCVPILFLLNVWCVVSDTGAQQLLGRLGPSVEMEAFRRAVLNLCSIGTRVLWWSTVLDPVLLPQWFMCDPLLQHQDFRGHTAQKTKPQE